MPAFIPYVGLFSGILLYLAGVLRWNFGATVPDDEDLDAPTEKDIRWGMIAAIVGLIVIALSVLRILAQLWELYNYYSN